MFEKTLQNKLKSIFEVNKVTYDKPSDAHEQDCIFVEIDTAKNMIRNGIAHARVEGKCLMFVPSNQLPFAYFSKKIASHPDETKDLFFYDLETNVVLQNNIVQRGFSFVYFFNSQYDPPPGNINSIETEVTT